MDGQYASFAEYLKNLKNRPITKRKSRVEMRKQRLHKRDELRASKRTHSPMPPTPLKPKSLNVEHDEMGAHTAQAATAAKRAPSKSVEELMARMNEWRTERDKKRAVEKAKRKPVFKTSKVAEIPPLAPFVPPLAGKNYAFKAPVNIQPIAFQRSTREATSNRKRETRSAVDVVKPVKIITKVDEGEHEKVLPTRRKLYYQGTEEGQRTDAPSKEAEDAKPTRKTTRQTSQAASSKSVPGAKTTKGTKTALQVKTKQIDEAIPTQTASQSELHFTRSKKLVLIGKPTAIETLPPGNYLMEPDEVHQVGTVHKSKKSVHLGTPKTPKSPKTPKASKGKRSSAGRTPARHLGRKEDDLESECIKSPMLAQGVDELTSQKEVLSAGSTNSGSTVFPFDALDSTFTIDDDDEGDKHKTPDNLVEPPVYVSPFVTMSRGKASARSEYKSRVSKGGESITSPDATGIKAGAAYFYKLLDDEIARIRGLCDQWEAYRTDGDLPEEVCNMISVPIGQANLLTTKKMRQFRALIDKSLQSTDGLAVTCADLHGFWDTVKIQLDNLDMRFNNLVQLRENAWSEVLPPIQHTAPPRRVMPKRSTKAAAAAPASKIRDLIRAARANCASKSLAPPPAGETGAEFHVGFFSINSPVRSSPRRTPARETRTSLLKSALHSAKRRSVRGSPGLAMMKATQNLQQLVDEKADALNTPTRSILKQATPKSTVKKAVIFKEVEAEIRDYESPPYEDEEDREQERARSHRNDENDCNLSNRAPNVTPAKVTPRRSAGGCTPVRRSRRLSRAAETP